MIPYSSGIIWKKSFFKAVTFINTYLTGLDGVRKDGKITEKEFDCKFFSFLRFLRRFFNVISDAVPNFTTIFKCFYVFSPITFVNFLQRLDS